MAHYYSEKQDTKTGLKKIKIHLKNISFELFSGDAVFSKAGLDNGTRELIENCQVKDNETVLDIGCGIGVVGIALKKTYPGLTIVMSDVNEWALSLAWKNVKLHHYEDTFKVIKSNTYGKITETFDTILSNPPQAAGKNVCFGIIEGARKHLKKGGSLQLVARHGKGGASLETKMEEVFGNVEQISRGSGFRVYMSVSR